MARSNVLGTALVECKDPARNGVAWRDASRNLIVWTRHLQPVESAYQQTVESASCQVDPSGHLPLVRPRDHATAALTFCAHVKHTNVAPPVNFGEYECAPSVGSVVLSSKSMNQPTRRTADPLFELHLWHACRSGRWALCRSFHATQQCRYGERCLFAHVVRSSPDSHSGMPCPRFARSGYCRYLAEGLCLYRHSHSDQPQRFRYKTIACRQFLVTGTCRYGSKCEFLHADDVL